MSLRLVHFSDTHLGYRAYNRLNSRGLNLREVDVFDAFRRTLALISELEPDLVLLSGDVFHSVRPSNLTVYQTLRELRAFRQRCSAPLVVIAGNHESPRSQDTGCVLRLFDMVPDITVVDTGFQEVVLPGLDTSVFCLPHRALPALERLDLKPSGTSRRNILMVHGTVEGIRIGGYDGQAIPRSRVINDAWDYIACGHYHLYTKLAENAYYSGSTEYTSRNLWEETKKPKGFIEWDLEERKELRFHEIETRPVVILPPIDCDGRSPDEVMAKIAESVSTPRGGIEEKVARLVLEGMTRQAFQHLDHRVLREYRASALHLEISLRPPQGSPGGSSPTGERQSRTLEMEWEEFIDAGEIPAGLERPELKTRGLQVLSEVEVDLSD
ncbi:MAG TPA: exonuclease SbcCD subunit D [Armatimonadota bacterium]|jgi:DNA repair exonuclease SbcCD nuclease subunit